MIPTESDIARAICCPGGCKNRGDCSSFASIKSGAAAAVLSLFDGAVEVRVVKHGFSGRRHTTPEYRAWSAMKTRCYNRRARSYTDYGARGIAVCDRWRRSFENFLRDVGRRPSAEHSLERINNAGNYEPSNVRWATATDQQNNRRTTIFVNLRGRRVPLKKACRVLGIDHRMTVIYNRIKRGWTPERAVKTPIRERRRLCG